MKTSGFVPSELHGFTSFTFRSIVAGGTLSAAELTAGRANGGPKGQREVLKA